MATFYYLLMPWVLMPIGFMLAFRYWKFVGPKVVALFFCLQYAFIVVSIKFGGIGMPADMRGWVMHGMWMTYGGYFPGVDFTSPYNIGFNGLLAGCSFLRPGSLWPLSLCFIGACICSVFFVYSSVKGVFGEKIARQSLILFAFSPISWYASEGMQDEWVQLLGVSVAMWMAVRQRWLCVGLTMASTFLFSKFLAVIYFGHLLLVRRLKGMVWLLIVVGAYVCAMHMAGVNVLDLRFGRALGMGDVAADQVGLMCTRGSVWALLPCVSQIVCYLVLLIAIGLSALVFLPMIARKDIGDRVRLTGVIGGMSLMYMLFGLFSPMAWSYYFLPILPFSLALILSFKKAQKSCLCMFYVLLYVCSVKDLVSSTLSHHESQLALAYVSLNVIMASAFILLTDAVEHWRKFRISDLWDK